MHTFFDGSGTVFFNRNTGEKLILSVTPERLEPMLDSVDLHPELIALFESNFIKWIDTVKN